MSLLEVTNNCNDKTESSSALLPSRSKYTFHVKKTIAAISATKFLPRTHKLRVGMENNGANTFIGAFNADKRNKALALARSSKVTVSSEGSDGADDMWAKPKQSPRINSGVNIVRPASSLRIGSGGKRKAEDEDDDDLFAVKSPRVKEKEKKSKEIVGESSNIVKEFDLFDQVDDYLLQIIADVLKTPESVIQQQHVRDEVDYVFATWRRPHLLLDYYRMHSSTPEIQNNFRRYSYFSHC